MLPQVSGIMFYAASSVRDGFYYPKVRAVMYDTLKITLKRWASSTPPRASGRFYTAPSEWRVLHRPK